MAWIFLNDAFLSIVRDPRAKNPHTLLVRARAKGDIERAFPRAKVVSTPNRDYAYRAYIQEAQVAAAIAFRITGIDYGNFKSSVVEDDRHDAYMRVWSAMYGFQTDRVRRERPSPWGRAEAEDLEALEEHPSQNESRKPRRRP